MIFITGPLYSGKRTFARNFRGSVIADVQDAAAETQTPEQLETLARELAEHTAHYYDRRYIRREKYRI